MLSKNEIWCSFRILKRELTINGKAILCNADQKISSEQFEKAALDVIIHRIWKDDEAATQSLLHINTSFWQLDLFEFLQIKSTFQALKMGELMALPMRGHYYLPEAVYLNKMADAFINMAKQCSVGTSSIYAVYAYVNAQRHLRELLASLETHAPLRTKLYAAVEPVQKLLSELNKIYRIEPNFVSMYCLAAALCEGQAQFALDVRPYLRDAIEHAPEELKLSTAGIFLQYGVSEKQMHPDNERALQCFKKALQLDENYYPAIFQIACLCALGKKYAEAKLGFRKVAFLSQGNYNHRDWRDLSLNKVLYVFRCYIWLTKLALNPNNTSPAYVTGRIFALLVSGQHAIVPENQSQYDKRFLSRVVTNPVKVMPTIQMNFMQLKNRAQKSNRMGTYNAINNQIMDLIDMLDGNYPGRLTQVQRGEFFIGYNQQMHYNRDAAIAKKREKEENTIAMSAVNTVATVDETTVA